MVTVDVDEGVGLLSGKSTRLAVEVTTWTEAGVEAATVPWVDKVFVIVSVVRGTPGPWFSVSTIVEDFVAVTSDFRVEEDDADAESVCKSVMLAYDADVDVE